MKIVRTEGYTVYSAIVNDENIGNYSKEELKNIILDIFNKRNFSEEQYKNILTELLHEVGDFEYLYTCDVCEYKLEI